MEILLAGKPAAEKLLSQVTGELSKILELGKPAPHLAVIQVGDDPASTVYVNNKIKVAKKLSITSTLHHFPAEISENSLLNLIDELNENWDVNGILIQLPLPSHISSELVMARINPLKDVDCLHPENVGKLWLGNAYVKPCTPEGIIKLLKFYELNIEGKHAVIIGRSNIVGKPLSALLLAENVTVTICHSKTRELENVTREADILICAVGRARLVRKNFVRQGAIVVDVGVNRELSEQGEQRLVGDVDFDEVKDEVYAISPVPGGVGPMTIAQLMENILICAKAQAKF